MTIKTTFALALTAAVGLAACDGTTNKATPERLEALRTEGINPDRRAKEDQRFANTLARANSIAEVNADFGQSAVDNPANAALPDLLQNALERNTDIGRAAQNINRADAERLNAIFGYLPQVSANFTRTQVRSRVISSDNAVFQLGTATYGVTTMGATVTQPLVNVSRIFAIQTATTARTIAEVRYIAAVQKAIFDTTDTYLAAAASKMRMQEYQTRGASLGRQAATEMGLADSGLASDQARRALLSEQGQVQSDYALEAANYAQLLGRLSALTGTAISGVGAVSAPGGISGTEGRMSVAQAVALAEKNNPEILAIAMSVVEADLARKGAMAADFGPVVDAFANIERETRGGSRFGGGSKTQEMTAGVQVTIPLFNARGDGLRTLNANVDLRSAVVDYHATRRELETRIAMTLERMKQLSTASGQLSQAYRAAQANVQSERDLVASGQSNDLVLAARQRLASQLQVQAEVQRVEYLRAWNELQYLTGALNTNALR
ncbi:TolC family protein [Maritimibacter sp. DP1N21-5]|uniref:TolC family protein n=1 Tax=Maritimibacter sp. DP1N21-5 TaxID=2836867 RepID=UPI001C45290D|nr:TolC family protein [Maritimibacter sp. DP1N21-5]MBV7407465.1 TolC family protein [Maritimibacter sp. DP1N21-5]